MEQPEEDLLDIALASARMMTTGQRRYSLDEVLAQFGYTREALRDPKRVLSRGEPPDHGEIQRAAKKTKRRKR